MSGWLLMGLPGLAYWTGLAEAGWTAIGLFIGTYFNWLIVSKRLRRYSERLDAITIPSFFSRRFPEKNNLILSISSLFIIIFFLSYAEQIIGFVKKQILNLRLYNIVPFAKCLAWCQVQSCHFFVCDLLACRIFTIIDFADHFEPSLSGC